MLSLFNQKKDTQGGEIIINGCTDDNYIQVLSQKKQPIMTGYVKSIKCKGKLHKSVITIAALDDSSETDIEFNLIKGYSRMDDGRMRIWL